MQKRILLSIFVMVLFINAGGCTSTQSEAPKTELQSTANKPQEKDTEASINRDQQTVHEAGQQSQPTQLEAATADRNTSDPNRANNIESVNYSDDTGSYTTARIDFLTEDDFKKALNQLIILGYLNTTSPNEESFKLALSQFQKEQGLKASGLLDAETIKILDSKAGN